MIHSDNGIVSAEGKEEFKAMGIKWEVTVPYSHRQNGFIERINKEVFKELKIILAERKLGDDNNFGTWFEELGYVCYNINNAYNRAIDGSSFEMLFGRKPTFIFNEE